MSASRVFKETYHNINSLLFGCILLLCFLNGAYSRNVIDSLRSILQSEEENITKAIQLDKLCWEYLQTGNYDTALEYSKAALQLSQRINFKKGVANSINNIGNIHYKQGSYPQALEYYFKSLKIREEILEQAERDKNYDEIADSKKNIATSYSNIGVINRKQNNYPLALEYDLKSLKIREEILKLVEHRHSGKSTDAIMNCKKDISASYNNLGNDYYIQNNYPLALEYYFKSLNIDEELGNKKGMTNSYNNMGNIHYFQGNYSSALENYLKSFSIDEELGDKHGMTTSLTNISIVYLKQKQYQQAFSQCGQVLSIAKEIGSKESIRDAYGCLAEALAGMNDYKEAYRYNQLYSSMKDSIISEESTKQVHEMEIKYETEKKKKTMLVQQIQINQKNYIIFGLLIFVLLIVVMAFVIVRQNKLLANQKALKLEGRLLRSQLNPHFIFNALSAIKASIPNKPPEVSSEFLTKFSRLMRSILETSKEEYISLEEEIKIITHYLELQKLRFDNKFEYHINISPEIEPELLMVPPMLAQPFIENAVEHGIKNMPIGGLITVRLLMNKTTLHLEIEDNGIGLSKTRNQTGNDHKPMAVDITKERLKNLNRSRRQKINITITDLNENDSSQPSPINRSGTKVVFAIPLT